MKQTKENMLRQSEAREHLKTILTPGMTIYTSLRHVAPSGMSRVIACHIIKDGAPLRLSGYIAAALGWSMKATRCGEGINVGGCGMDMGFHIVNSLCYALWGMDTPNAGYQIKQEWL